VALVSAGTGPYEELLDITRPSRRRFADLHGMTVVETTDLLCGDRPASWHKVVLMQHLLASGRFDAMVWLDADAIVVDPSVDPVSELSPQVNLAVVHHRFGPETVPNAGVFVLRAGQWSVDLLEAMWARVEFIEHRWWENAALLALCGYTTEPPVVKHSPSPLDRAIGELPLRWNAIPQAAPPDAPAIVHLPGYDHSTRVRCLSMLAADPGRAREVLDDPLQVGVQSA
jgi:hypothetical protein